MAIGSMTGERVRARAVPFRFAISDLLLVLVVVIEIAFGVLYAVRVPAWEAPDEPAHYNFVRHIAETGTLPVLQVGDYDQAYLDKIKAAKFPAEMSVDPIRYEMYQPPLYYLAATPVYLAARAAGVSPLLALRLFSVLLGAAILVLAYRLLLHVFSKNRFLALAAVALMAAIPMNIALWASVNADPLAELLAAALLLVAIERAEGEMSDRAFVLLGGVLFGLVLLASTKIYPAAVLLVIAEAARLQRAGLFRLPLASAVKRSAGLLGLVLLIALALSGWWFVRNVSVYGGLDVLGWARHDSVVTGQARTADWLGHFGVKFMALYYLQFTFQSFWGQFGWMGILVDNWIYVALTVVTLACLFGLVLWGIRQARMRGRELAGTGWAWLLMFVWLAIILLAYLWYNTRFVQAQGRYLFPALIPIAACLVLGLHELIDKRYAKATFVILYLCLLLFDWASLYRYIIPQLRG